MTGRKTRRGAVTLPIPRASAPQSRNRPPTSRLLRATHLGSHSQGVQPAACLVSARPSRPHRRMGLAHAKRAPGASTLAMLTAMAWTSLRAVAPRRSTGVGRRGRLGRGHVDVTAVEGKGGKDQGIPRLALSWALLAGGVIPIHALTAQHRRGRARPKGSESSTAFAFVWLPEASAIIPRPAPTLNANGHSCSVE